MKKILFFLIFLLSIQGIVFAEGENGIIETETAVEARDIKNESGFDSVELNAFGNINTLSASPLFDGTTLMLPIKEVLMRLGISDFSVDDTKQITMLYGENIIIFYPDSIKAIMNNQTIELPVATYLFNGVIYAPAETICKNLGFNFYTIGQDNKLLVYIFPSNETETDAARYVNSKDLSSETQCLIWVNKQKYTVYAFVGENGNWREVYSCPCAIGAPNTPTVTGVFKYFSRESKWSYAKFYVAPIMRFYRGYAIHSTLLKYDGSDYNNAVGVKNSHGCVRVRPSELSWLVSNVPLNTTVYVSENDKQ